MPFGRVEAEHEKPADRNQEQARMQWWMWIVPPEPPPMTTSWKAPRLVCIEALVTQEGHVERSSQPGAIASPPSGPDAVQ